MEIFIGSKTIKAISMDRAAYNTYRGWDLPANEEGSDKGFLVEYVDGGPSNHADHKGYISWSPKLVFESSYFSVTSGISFGSAIQLLKGGYKVGRKGWNGKGMFLYYVPAASYPPQTHAAVQAFNGALVPYGAYIAMKTAQDNVVPWLASQTDMLADDWVVQS